MPLRLRGKHRVEEDEDEDEDEDEGSRKRRKTGTPQAKGRQQHERDDSDDDEEEEEEHGEVKQLDLDDGEDVHAPADGENDKNAGRRVLRTRQSSTATTSHPTTVTNANAAATRATRKRSKAPAKYADSSEDSDADDDNDDDEGDGDDDDFQVKANGKHRRQVDNDENGDDNDDDEGDDDEDEHGDDEDDDGASTPKKKKQKKSTSSSPSTPKRTPRSARSILSPTASLTPMSPATAQYRASQLSQFRDGSILRVKICNFMTYDDVEFEPGPRLNLVLGPNGTGKSSIVSALCLGLGGATKVLGRADLTRDFIKHGKDKAFVEITLRKAPHDVVLRRTLSGRDNTSTWHVNGKTAKKSTVDELIQDLNIRLDNLTQFLPQDKVARFAALTSIELLQETEEAVLPAKSVLLHKELVEIKKNFASQAERVQVHRNMLETEISKNEKLEREVKLFEQRKQHLLRIELLQLREPFIVFQNLQNQAIETKRQFEQQRELLEKKRATLEPMTQQHKTLEQNQKHAEHEYNENIKDLRKRKQGIEKKGGDIEQHTNTVDEAQSAIDGLHKRAQERDVKRRKLQNDLERERREFENLTDLSAIEEKRRQKNNEIDQVQEKLAKVKERKDEIGPRKAELQRSHNETQARIQALEDVKARRLQTIRNINRDSFEAWEWYRSNSNRFQRPVHLLPLSINPKDDLSARNIEHHLPQYLLTALVCESRTDRDLIDQEFMGSGSRRSGLTLLALRDDATWKQDAVQRPADLKTLAAYGITAYLDQCIDAPPAIMMILDDMARITQVAVGSARTQDPSVLERLWRETRLETVFTPTMQYMTSTSRYASQVRVTRSTRVRERRIFSGIDLNEHEKLLQKRNELVADLQKEDAVLRDIDKEEQQLTKQRELLKGMREQLVVERREREKKKQKIATLTAAIQNLEQEEDTADEENILRAQICDTNHERAKIALEIAKQYQEFCDLSLSQDNLTLRRQKLTRQIVELEQERKKSTRELDELEETVNQLQDQLGAEKNRLKTLKTQAFSARKEFADAHEQAENDVNDLLVNLPDNLDDLHEQIRAEQTAAANIADNPHVIVEYEQRKKKIGELRAVVEELEQQKKQTEDKMNEAMEKWLLPLRKCVKLIDKHFRDLCAHVGISGEVGLGETEDFEKFHISIKVKFRDNEDLSQLSEHRQSGGERSVTTILYLLALQSLNKCPFRVVDEINQGMDPENERKIFHQMLRSSKGDSVPQCFLITPKLLPDLVPSDCPELTILFIYNGAWNLKQLEWTRLLNSL